MSKPRRVVITGIGLVSPLGKSLDELFDKLSRGETSMVSMPHWAEGGLSTRVGSIVQDFDERSIPRQLRRSMSRVSQMAVTATGNAIRDADLSDELVKSERTGISYGSTMGGTSALEKYYTAVISNGNVVDGVMSTTFLQIMSHTCAANIGIAFEIPGRVIASCTACSASTQAIGFGYESVRHGLADRMICGGAEEMHITVTGVFDVMRATSTKFNHQPDAACRPFSSDRDGIVVGEGAGTLVLEDYDTAIARGAKIYAEVTGFHTNTDANHMTNPSVEGMERVMRGALASAEISPGEISYVNAHGTGTSVGDAAETKAVHQVFGSSMPISSLKGHFGHLMGACGVVETIACVGMFKNDRLIPTRNLETVAEDCAPLDYVRSPRPVHNLRHVVKNSFAFGGINASLVLSKVKS
jgi:3-oxoacyl-[acyl-carrier-protein] synthase II